MTEDVRSIDLDALEALLVKATPGPWEVAPNIATPRGDGVRSIEGPRLRGDGRTVSTIVADQSPTDDAHAIAALRNAAPELLRIARAASALSNALATQTQNVWCVCALADFSERDEYHIDTCPLVALRMALEGMR